jgi:hypothetical protein
VAEVTAAGRAADLPSLEEALPPARSRVALDYGATLATTTSLGFVARSIATA